METCPSTLRCGWHTFLTCSSAIIANASTSNIVFARALLKPLRLKPLLCVVHLDSSMLPPLSRGFNADYSQQFMMPSSSSEMNHENPFRMPLDDQVFRAREEERAAYQQQRARNMTLKVWEKSKKDVVSFSERLREIVG